MSQTTYEPLRAAPDRHRRRPRRGRLQPGVLGVIAAGGALGAPARYGVAQLGPVDPGRFPWSTLAVNVTGSLVLGVVLVLVLERFGPTRYLRPFLATGFLGAYTTYSTFAVETVLLVRDGHPGAAAVYTAVSMAGSLVAVWAGLILGRLVPLPTGGAR